MVHAIRVTWKLGLGLVSERHAARWHAAVECGYFVGSVLFCWGTVYFFPAKGLEDFVLGCRLYEAGSVIFFLLTAYSELDRFYARKQKGGARVVTQRELLEEMLYCLGSLVFLIGTFLFDPTFVDLFARAFGSSDASVENAAAAFFMVGSFMFSLGSYVNALSIFEAPKVFRRHYISVTTCYQFGGLLFVAGTMGYVRAFEPNLALRWASTWLYLVGCLFYVAGSLLSFVSTVARHQVRWERLQERERRSRRSMVRRVAGALPRALRAVGRRRRRPGPSAADDAAANDEDSWRGGVSPQGVALDLDLGSEGAVDAWEDLDLEDDDGGLPEARPAAGAAASAEAAADHREAEAAADDKAEVLGAFWRSVWAPGGALRGDAAAGELEEAAWAAESPTSTPPTSPSRLGGRPPRRGAPRGPAPQCFGAAAVDRDRDRDDRAFLDEPCFATPEGDQRYEP